jgi:hypothetical protein
MPKVENAAAAMSGIRDPAALMDPLQRAIRTAIPDSWAYSTPVAAATPLPARREFPAIFPGGTRVFRLTLQVDHADGPPAEGWACIEIDGLRFSAQVEA